MKLRSNIKSGGYAGDEVRISNFICEQFLTFSFSTWDKGSCRSGSELLQLNMPLMETIMMTK